MGGVKHPFMVVASCCPFVGVTGTAGFGIVLAGASEGGVGGATGYFAMAACFVRKSSRIIDTLARRGDAYFRERTVEGRCRCCDRVMRVCESYLEDQSACRGIGRLRMHLDNASEERAISDGRFEMNSLWNMAISAM